MPLKWEKLQWLSYGLAMNVTVTFVISVDMKRMTES
jgi:hypothetical protein